MEQVFGNQKCSGCFNKTNGNFAFGTGQKIHDPQLMNTKF